MWSTILILSGGLKDTRQYKSFMQDIILHCTSNNCQKTTSNNTKNQSALTECVTCLSLGPTQISGVDNIILFHYYICLWLQSRLLIWHNNLRFVSRFPLYNVTYTQRYISVIKSHSSYKESTLYCMCTQTTNLLALNGGNLCLPYSLNS